MVWQILCGIPAGQTMTYGQIAKKIAEKTGKTTMSAQAVGGAVGHNPISIKLLPPFLLPVQAPYREEPDMLSVNYSDL